MKYNLNEWHLALPEVGFILDLQRLYQQLSNLDDFRKRRGVRYPLVVVVMVVVLAKLAGMNKVQEIADWAKAHQSELAQLLGLKRKSMPHAATFSRVLD